VVAEGVETVDQLNFLKTHQCSDVQGFYFSKPLEVTELETYIKNLQ
jgi:EAL domain-containing protein (putative c-di-GMP-specific phosphodiesterase class I)